MDIQLIYLLIGIIVGGIGAYFIAKFKFQAEFHAAQKPQITAEEIEDKYVFREIHEDAKGQIVSLRKDLMNYQKDYERVSNALSAKEQYAENLHQKLMEGKQELEQVQQRLTTEFENIANKLLEEKSQKFTAQNQDNLNIVLQPLKEKIKEFEEKVERTYLEETKDRISLKTEITKLRELNMQLSLDASQLVSALKGDSKTQGDWGEYRLEMLLERAGLTKDIHFKTQSNFKDEEGNDKRPDFIIHLPEDKHLIVDSKVSLKAYEAYYNADNEEDRKHHLKSHVASVRKHLRDLNSKRYEHLYQINTPDYLLMFIPIEPAFAAAVKEDNNLFLEALDKNIVMVTTSTLLATMRTVSYIWKHEKQKSSVLEIAKQSGLLYDKFCLFVDDLKDIGKKLDNAQSAYHGAMNKLTDSKKFGDTLVGRAQRIKELGANSSKSLPQDLLDKID
ncbi:MAG: DNA recombination protein RmuC [Saprospiraceae bacterium]|jgi:DNA recombination protein RmuC